MSIRQFRAGDGRVLTLPMGLKTAPGATCMRLDADTIVELDFDDKRTKAHQRFIAIALNNGDMVEVVGAEPTPASPAPAASPKAFTVNAPKE